MECCLCKNSQHIGKSEYSMNVRTNTHRNDRSRAYGPPWDKYFQKPGHKFNEHAKFTIIKKINNAFLPRQIIKPYKWRSITYL